MKNGTRKRLLIVKGWAAGKTCFGYWWEEDKCFRCVVCGSVMWYTPEYVQVLDD